MKISRKAEYALRAMTLLSAAPRQQPFQIQDLAGQGEIPVKFLEQILLSLKRSGLLKSKRGVGGGYLLNHEPRAITVADVIEAIDGDLCSLAGEKSGPDFPGAAGLQDCLETVDQTVNDQLRSRNFEEILQFGNEADVGFGI
ncbi:MAG: Rrf2 family transcriptional regulator [Verrucomicrobiales bacterium]|nr:Rrf2 family transcriptional regulator [Verrucomicrobiales bacterium]